MHNLLMKSFVIQLLVLYSLTIVIVKKIAQWKKIFLSDQNLTFLIYVKTTHCWVLWWTSYSNKYESKLIFFLSLSLFWKFVVQWNDYWLVIDWALSSAMPYLCERMRCRWDRSMQSERWERKGEREREIEWESG